VLGLGQSVWFEPSSSTYQLRQPEGVGELAEQVDHLAVATA